jgi:activator of 2-hydroxyglutaryl-CoA dehydratase
MTITAGIDIGSTYTKAILFDDENNIVARAMRQTGFKLTEMSQTVFDECLSIAGLTNSDIAYTISTGIGRHQCDFKDLSVTDLTDGARHRRSDHEGQPHR